jgi:hypothetical protein
MRHHEYLYLIAPDEGGSRVVGKTLQITNKAIKHILGNLLYDLLEFG